MIYENIYIVLGISFLIIFIFGKLLNKYRVPWIFGAVLLGFIISIFPNLNTLTYSTIFDFLARLGMYLLLFTIGMRIDVNGVNKMKRFVVQTTLFIILLEGFVGGVFIYYVFNYSFLTSIMVALSFATVGEAVLIPILDEFNLTKKKLGQVILSIGTLDDVIEIILLIGITAFLHTELDIAPANILISCSSIIALTILLSINALKESITKKLNPQMLILIAMIIFFIFIGIGEWGGLEPIAAIFAGISIKLFFNKEAIETVEYQIQALTYGFFGLIFFIWIGSHIDYKTLLFNPFLIIAIFVISGATKIVASILAGKRELGFHNSMALGVALSMRFSTGIVVTKLLYDHLIIGVDLYTAIIASSILFMLTVPIALSRLIIKFKLNNRIDQDFTPKITI